MSLSTLDLNLLVTLDAVLTERSVVRAARRLHVTPSAVSNALARLRAAVGDPLLVRHGRGVLPTPRAAALAPAIARALGDLDQAIHGDSFDPATTDRELRLAIADVFQLVRLPAIVAAVAAKMPRARLRVLSIDTLVASGGLGGTEVDVVIGAGDKGPGVHAAPLYEERVVLVARAGHPALRGRLSKTKLAALRHVDVQVAPGKG
ncbi:MAG TPA: LysR family transcriptional regulator, partial [Polyangia bacterium]|nr:LysR family transcriptional regulator [Polyangia bacterium]